MQRSTRDEILERLLPDARTAVNPIAVADAESVAGDFDVSSAQQGDLERRDAIYVLRGEGKRR